MPKRVPGVESPCEAGLRELARGRGPSIGKLEYAAVHPDDSTDSLRELMRRTESMSTSSGRQRATALWEIIQEEIKMIDEEGQHPKCQGALRAAFRIPMEHYRGEEYDSIAKRLDQAKANGVFGPAAGQDAPVRSWGQGVRRLGHAVKERLDRLAERPEGWLAYQRDEPQTAAAYTFPAPEDAQPVFVDRLIATYRMKGRTVDYAITERLVTARADDVDHYIVRAYSPLTGEPKVQIQPLLNCRAGTLRSLPGGHGGETHEVPMYAPAPLRSGEQWFFASRVIHQEGTNELPIVEIQVTSHGIAAGGLTMRVQFEEGFYPVAAWWFADVVEGRQLEKPPEGHGRRLASSNLGFLEHTFTGLCKPLAKYGIGWGWP